VTPKPRVVTFRLDQATWDWMRELVPYTKYRNTSSFIREGIDLLLKREDEQPSGWTAGRGDGFTDRRPGSPRRSPMTVGPRRLTSSARPFDGMTGG
jgi:Arc/MetJ-type ribon-helix-helix transcriptional regulator